MQRGVHVLGGDAIAARRKSAVARARGRRRLLLGAARISLCAARAAGAAEAEIDGGPDLQAMARGNCVGTRRTRPAPDPNGSRHCPGHERALGKCGQLHCGMLQGRVAGDGCRAASAPAWPGDAPVLASLGHPSARSPKTSAVPCRLWSLGRADSLLLLRRRCFSEASQAAFAGRRTTCLP